jgi:putative copper resistance protein D
VTALLEPSVSVHVVLTRWQFDTISCIGLAIEAIAVAGYLVAVWALRRRGRKWPTARAISYVSGVTVIAFALQSGFSSYDDVVFWVHMTQHLILMMVAPPLLAVGAPITLLLAVLKRPGRRRVMGLLRDPAVRMVDGPAAAWLLPADYYGSMFVYMLTPLYRESEVNSTFHEFAHAYFLACGLLLWLPLIGLYPARWRPAYRVKLVVVAIGVPLYALLGILVGAEGRFVSPAHSVQSIRLGAWVLALLGAACSLFGLLVLWRVEAARTKSRAQRVAWRNGREDLSGGSVIGLEPLPPVALRPDAPGASRWCVRPPPPA